MGINIINDSKNNGKFVLSKDMLPVTTFKDIGDDVDREVYVWCYDKNRSKYCCVMLCSDVIKVYEFKDFEEMKNEVEDAVLNSDERLCDVDLVVRQRVGQCKLDSDSKRSVAIDGQTKWNIKRSADVSCVSSVADNGK